MKLFLMWLLGVPIAVTSMVMTHSLMESRRILKSNALSESLRIEILRNAEIDKTP